MLMTLGLFVFEIASLPYQDLSRQTEWRHAASDRFGARPAAQFLGLGSDKITLSGTLYPGIIGKYASLETIRAMADTGDAYVMVSGTGEVLGQWIIRSLAEKQSAFFSDGMPKKSDFTLELERFDA